MKKVQIIKKVWGKEEVICNNKKYAAKYLHLKKGYRCSLHYHKLKDETFIVRSGFVFFEYGKDYNMRKGICLSTKDSIRIKQGMYHRFTGLTDAIILEVSTEDKKEDSYRVTKSEKICN
jgi:mannose-6-phosphate isomerase-like protein (cupin superfamily)|tara:strand:- start:1095 stop:1451 length:357 start_codon:yes stop_codon:yes gene_type:complete